MDNFNRGLESTEICQMDILPLKYNIRTLDIVNRWMNTLEHMVKKLENQSSFGNSVG